MVAGCWMRCICVAMNANGSSARARTHAFTMSFSFCVSSCVVRYSMTSCALGDCDATLVAVADGDPPPCPLLPDVDAMIAVADAILPARPAICVLPVL